MKSITHAIQLSMFDGRVCTVCKTWKPFTEFGKMKRGLYGLRPNCKRCHCSDSVAYQKAHRAERNAFTRDWYARNIEDQRQKSNAKHARYRAINPERFRAAVRRSAEKNKERIRELRIARYHANLDAARAKCRADAKRWREKDPERAREISRIRRQNNPERYRDMDRKHWLKRRAIKLNAGGTIYVWEWKELKAKWAYACLACGRKEPDVELTLDHIIPLTKGGPNTIENCQPLCRSCNSAKHTKTIDYRGGLRTLDPRTASDKQMNRG